MNCKSFNVTYMYIIYLRHDFIALSSNECYSDGLPLFSPHLRVTTTVLLSNDVKAPALDALMQLAGANEPPRK